MKTEAKKTQGRKLEIVRMDLRAVFRSMVDELIFIMFNLYTYYLI